MKRYIVTFEVSGKGLFPADMLRHDACYPADTTSALNITAHGSSVYRTVALRCRVEASNPHAASARAVTVARWASFGWGVRIIHADEV